MMQDYFSKVQRKLDASKELILEQSVQFEVVSGEMGILNGSVVFIDGSSLEFMELVSETEYEYRFQLMDKNKELICRWDSAPHHKEIATFPYHLHTKSSVKESERVNTLQILDTAIEKVVENLSA
jgi:hypothetical protein